LRRHFVHESPDWHAIFVDVSQDLRPVDQRATRAGPSPSARCAQRARGWYLSDRRPLWSVAINAAAAIDGCRAVRSPLELLGSYRSPTVSRSLAFGCESTRMLRTERAADLRHGLIDLRAPRIYFITSPPRESLP